MSSTFDYLTSRDTADRLVTKFGQSISLRREVASGSAFDPTLTPTDYATKGAKVEFTWSQRQGGDVLATDERWIIAAGPLAALGITEILPSDHIVVGGVERSVGPMSKAVSPAGTVVVFDVQAQL